MEVEQKLVGSFVDALVNDPELAKSLARDCPDLVHARWGPWGTSVLHFLVIENFQSGVRCAHQLGCDVNVTDKYGGTPLLDAVNIGNLEMVRMLLGMGADPNAVSPSYGTALDAATMSCYDEIAEMIKAHGGQHEIEPEPDLDLEE